MNKKELNSLLKRIAERAENGVSITEFYKILNDEVKKYDEEKNKKEKA